MFIAKKKLGLIPIGTTQNEVASTGHWENYERKIDMKNS